MDGVRTDVLGKQRLGDFIGTVGGPIVDDLNLNTLIPQTSMTLTRSAEASSRLHGNSPDRGVGRDRGAAGNVKIVGQDTEAILRGRIGAAAANRAVMAKQTGRNEGAVKLEEPEIWTSAQ
jgi:hypothetical protein